MKFLLIAAVALTILSGCGPDEPPAPVTVTLKSEDLVRLTQGYVCGTEAKFIESVQHSVANEKTLLRAMFDSNECWIPGKDETMRIVHATSEVAQVMMEHGSSDATAWTAPEFLKIYSPALKS